MGCTSDRCCFGGRAVKVCALYVRVATWGRNVVAGLSIVEIDFERATSGARFFKLLPGRMPSPANKFELLSGQGLGGDPDVFFIKRFITLL